jgi:TPP-dependent pyruvate/acetoin dehydrogenase alpha subunit
MDLIQLLQSMLLIRAFESALTRHPQHGFQLLSSGEEAVAVGLCAALVHGDLLLSSGRSIGPALARGLDPRLVMAELLGKVSGPCQGRGGRGHLSQPSVGYFGAHAVVGGNLSIAAGVALAAQQQRSGAIVACIFGDGACGSGALHETLNIAALWNLPLLFVCDNNQYSVSTRRADALAPHRLSDLAAPFGIPAMTIDGMDVAAVADAANVYAGQARAGRGPAFLECVCDRFATHSTATAETRSPEALHAMQMRCPIERLASQLVADGTADNAFIERLRHQAAAAAADAVVFADAAPYPNRSEILAHVT